MSKRKYIQKKATSSLLFGLAFLFSLMSQCLPVSADYRVEPGDQIAIFVAGLPELQRTETIDPDGFLSFPLVGRVYVENASMAEVTTKIRTRMAAKIVKKANPDGSISGIPIESADIFVTLGKTRPIYVGGNVKTPGEYSYHATMTVREAIAIAGGYKKIDDSPIQRIEMIREKKVLLWENANLRINIWRVICELGEDEKTDQDLLRELAIQSPSERINLIAMIKIAKMRRDESISSLASEMKFLHMSIDEQAKQIATLTKQEQAEERGLADDSKELDKLTSLYKKGKLNNIRMTNARRAVLLSSTRVLQTKGRLMDAQQRRDDLVRATETKPAVRRRKLRQELQNFKTQIGSNQIELQAINKKLDVLTINTSQTAKTGAPNMKVIVYRKVRKKETRIEVDLSFELLPGDFVQIYRADPIKITSDMAR